MLSQSILVARPRNTSHTRQTATEVDSVLAGEDWSRGR